MHLRKSEITNSIPFSIQVKNKSMNHPIPISNETVLTERQIKSLAHFLHCGSIEETCRGARISKTTYYEWMQNPFFKTELKRLRNAILDEAVDRLRSNAAKAVTKLINLMENSSSENVQRMAANDVLEHLKYMTLREDVVEKINELYEKAGLPSKY